MKPIQYISSYFFLLSCLWFSRLNFHKSNNIIKSSFRLRFRIFYFIHRYILNCAYLFHSSRALHLKRLLYLFEYSSSPLFSNGHMSMGPVLRLPRVNVPTLSSFYPTSKPFERNTDFKNKKCLFCVPKSLAFVGEDLHVFIFCSLNYKVSLFSVNDDQNL